MVLNYFTISKLKNVSFDLARLARDLARTSCAVAFPSHAWKSRNSGFWGTVGELGHETSDFVIQYLRFS